MEDQDKRFEEIENVEEIEDAEGETPQRSGIGTFGAMAIGSGLTLGGIALFKKLRKVVAEKKAAKNAAKEETEVVEVEVIEEAGPQSETKVEQPEK